MTLAIPRRVQIRLRSTRNHPEQGAFVHSRKKRNIVRAGRRGGKTVGAATRDVERFIHEGRRILYLAPTQEQVDTYWREVNRALRPLIECGYLVKNETRRMIEVPGTEQRLRCKTAWNPDTMRGDYADDITFDEWQLCDEDMWGQVGAPMLLDNDGDAMFIYTPPSLRARSISRARNPLHASKMFKMAEEDTTGRWGAFTFSSHANPHISEHALAELSGDMTQLAIRQEIMAEDSTEIQGALWTLSIIDPYRVAEAPDRITRVIVAVDPTGGEAECGIVAGFKGSDDHYYVLADRSLYGSPHRWATAAIALYDEYQADRVVAEVNYGGDMVESTLRNVDPNVSYRSVSASRGKAVRAEPVVALYERGLVHHVGDLATLEEELVSWVPESSMRSPNRLDALVWLITDLMGGGLSMTQALAGGERQSMSDRLGGGYSGNGASSEW